MLRLRRLGVKSSASFSQGSRRGLASLRPAASLFTPLDAFPERHIGPDNNETSFMLKKLGYKSMDAFIQDAVPEKIRVSNFTVNNTSIPPLSESELFTRAKKIASDNRVFKSYIGMGYHSAVVPPVILRNVISSFLSTSGHYTS